MLAPNYFQINKPSKLKTLKKKETTMEQQNTTPQHNHSLESAVLLSLIPYAKVPSPCCGSPRPRFHRWLPEPGKSNAANRSTCWLGEQQRNNKQKCFMLSLPQVIYIIQPRWCDQSHHGCNHRATWCSPKWSRDPMGFTDDPREILGTPTRYPDGVAKESWPTRCTTLLGCVPQWY